MNASNTLGEQGESIAFYYLVNKGYTILGKNVRFGKIELDLVAEKDGVVVVVEVKARSSDDYGTPESFVNEEKENFLVEGLSYYLNKYELDCEARIDVIAILIKEGTFELRHHEGAVYGFDLP